MFSAPIDNPNVLNIKHAEIHLSDFTLHTKATIHLERFLHSTIFETLHTTYRLFHTNIINDPQNTNQSIFQT